MYRFDETVCPLSGNGYSQNFPVDVAFAEENLLGACMPNSLKRSLKYIINEGQKGWKIPLQCRFCGHSRERVVGCCLLNAFSRVNDLESRLATPVWPTM